MKPTVRKLKNVRGRITGYQATIGPVSAEGKDAPEAVLRCEDTTMAALARLDRGTLVGSWRGHMYIVMPTTYGWVYTIDTFSRIDMHVYGSWVDREAAQDAATHHLAQTLWTLDVEDATFVEGLHRDVAEKIQEWARWQRRYAAHVASGKSDNEARELLRAES